jgi:N-acetylneuraminate lyase
MSEFKGIYCAILTPFGDDEELAIERLGGLLDYLYDAGISGVYASGSTGEGVFLTVEERMRLAEYCMESSEGRGQVIVHVGAMTTRDSCRLAEHAGRIGADGISSLPPLYFQYTVSEVKAHYAEIAGACGLPLFAYHIPHLVNFSVTVDLMRELLEIPTVRGLKFTDSNLYEERKMLEQFGGEGFTLFHGMDQTLLAALVMGAEAAIGGTYNVMARLFVRLYRAWKAGEIGQARELQYRAAAVIPVLQQVSILPAIKQLLAARGIDLGRCRRPLRMLSEGELEGLNAALEAAGGLPD